MNETVATADELWLHGITRLEMAKQRGSRDGECTETLGARYRLVNSCANVVTHSNRGFDVSYAAAETLWYLSGEDSIERIVAYAPQYERFAENGIAFGAYGARWKHDVAFKCVTAAYHDQLDAVVALLREKPETRQAIVTMWNAGDLPHAVWGWHADVPCTLSLQFLARDGLLHLIATMRSNDVWLGTPYDVFAFTTLQQLIAEALDLTPGSYVHQVGSFHLYTRNAEKAERCDARNAGSTAEPVVWLPNPLKWHEAVRLACDLEIEVRSAYAGLLTREHVIDVTTRKLGEGTLLRDLVVACAIKFGLASGDDLHHPGLRLAAERKEQ